jgi:hypothetical protein
MKTRNFLSLAAVALLPLTSSLRAEPVDFSSLPFVVQDAINAQRGPSGVMSVERVDRFGTPLYRVRLDQPGANNEFYINDTGALVNLSPPDGLLSGARELALSALPAPVQNTLRAQFGNQAIPNVEQLTANGQTAYMVPARVDGRVMDLWIDPNGNVLTFSPPRVLLSNSKRIRPDELPGPVQDTLRTYAGNDPIMNISRGIAQGQTVYDAIIKHSGRNIDLRMAEDGSLVRDAVNDRFLADTGSMTRRGLAAIAPVRIPLSNRTTVSFNQLPLPVLSTVQNYAGGDFIEKIERGVARGQTVYEASFRHAGEEVPLRVAENGSLINDRVNESFLAQLGSRPIAVGQAPAWQSQSGTGYAPAR